MESLSEYHLSIVRGGAFSPADAAVSATFQYLRDEHVKHGEGPFTSEWMAAVTQSNKTLLRYMYPHDPVDAYHRGDVSRAWRAATKGCKIVAAGCYCFHVPGSPEKARNPNGWKGEAVMLAHTMHLSTFADPKAQMVKAAAENCSCLAPSHPQASCLFSDMRPGKLLAIIAACRAAGVTHIIEEGRYGGLSAYMYALHGFKVTSLELVEIEFVARALRTMAPTVAQVVGDGSKLIPRLVTQEVDPRRVAIIFDGEKRFQAYQTYKKVKDRIAIAVFDDSIFQAFPAYLETHGETAWHTWDRAFVLAHRDVLQTAPFEDDLRQMATHTLPSMGLSGADLRRLVDLAGRLKLPPGGMESLSEYHLSIVRGGAFSPQ